MCAFADNCNRNQGSGGYGQNLASWGTSGALTDDSRINAAAGGVSNQWYNSEMLNWQFYGLDNPPSSSSLYDWGHFTQVVWKDVTKVGCATVKCASGTVLSMNSWYTVCNYNPPGKFTCCSNDHVEIVANWVPAGNYGGQYGKNVLKPLGHSISSVSM